MITEVRGVYIIPRECTGITALDNSRRDLCCSYSGMVGIIFGEPIFRDFTIYRMTHLYSPPPQPIL